MDTLTDSLIDSVDETVEPSDAVFRQLLQAPASQANNYNQLFIPDVVRTIHGAVDFKPEGMMVGLGYEIQSTDGPKPSTLYLTYDAAGLHSFHGDRAVTLNQSNYFVKSSSPPPLDKYWRWDMINYFFENPTCPDNLFQDLITVIKTHIWLPNPDDYGLLAAWIICTYFAHIFNEVPYLWLSGPKGCGKSNLLAVLGLTCFNPTQATLVTPAALANSMDQKRGTLLMDQCDIISHDVQGLLTGSYKKNGAARLFLHTGKDRMGINESAYGSKAFATIKQLPADLADRCIKLNLQRAEVAYPDVSGNEDTLVDLRDKLFRFLLLRSIQIRNVYCSIPTEGARQDEIWRPLLAVLTVLNVSPAEIMRLKSACYNGTEKTKDMLSLQEEALFHVLQDEVRRRDVVELTAKDLLTSMAQMLEEENVPKAVDIGMIIKKFDLAEEKRRKTRMKRVHYKFQKEKVLSVARCYDAFIPDEQLNAEGTL